MRGRAEELAVGDGPDAVPTARRFTRQVLRSSGFAELVDDAAMVVTELLTNALLHGGPPVVLRLDLTADRLRIEVQDPDRHMPMRVLSGDESMTGRGLSLVETLSSGWGVEPLPTGKVVWCELRPGDEQGTPSERGNGYGPPGPSISGDGRPRYTVSLGEVSTELLLQSKAHVDNLVRELTLMSVGARAGHGTPLPERLADMIESVVSDFADVRAALRRQAIGAAEAGRERTELTLTLPVDAVATAEAYLTALDEADAYARAGHLLTLETPPGQRAFRQWYITNLVTQLTAAARGQQAPPPELFESRLVHDLDRVEATRRAAARSARLQPVTAALAAVTTDRDVARIAAEEAVIALGAIAASVVTRDPDTGLLQVPGDVGFPEGFHERMTQQQLEAHGPATQALNTGEPVWVRSVHEAHEFPIIGQVEPDVAAVCAVPLAVGDHVLGVLRLSFAEPQTFDADERTFLSALAAQTAQALERTALHRAERQARSAAEAVARRLERLQLVTAAMAAAAQQDDVVEIVVVQLGEALGSAITSLSMLDGDRLRIVRIRGARTGVLERWGSYPVDADLPASEAVRTGRAVVVPHRLLVERYPLLAGEGRPGGSLVCLPLVVRHRVLGVVTLTFPHEAPVEDPAELTFLEALANTCAQALDRAEALTQAREATERLAVLAEASAELADSRAYRETLSRIAQLVVPRLADWCAITVVEGGRLLPVTVAHVDPEKVSWARRLQDQYPVDPDATTGVPQVIRTGVSELYPQISDEMLQASARDEEHLRIARELRLSSAVIAPLTGRTGTLGALQLVYSDSRRTYTLADLAMVEDLARRAAVAVENARAFELQQARLASISRVAEVAQHAILAPIPSRCGPVRLAGAYVSASKDALIGGDLYEVVVRGDAVRLLIGDVRGKGLDAVRLATVVLGLFRTAAADHDDVAEVARQMDARIGPYLEEEDFVTALLVEVAADGECRLVSCGHPSPLLAQGGALRELDCPPAVPLGLGVQQPQVCTEQLRPGDRLLLYTDGLIETRDRVTGEFVQLDDVARPLATGHVAGVLGNILARVQQAAGQQLADDLAMLVVEYAG